MPGSAWRAPDSPAQESRSCITSSSRSSPSHISPHTCGLSAQGLRAASKEDTQGYLAQKNLQPPVEPPHLRHTPAVTNTHHTP